MDLTIKNQCHTEEDLTNFICSKDLKNIEHNCNKFNIFECLGLNMVETRHSYFLKWLLDPYETHGLNDCFLKLFLKNILKRNLPYGNVVKKFDYIFPTVIDIDCWDMSNVKVEREVNNIDLLITDSEHKFVCVIENKIDYHQHSNQLTVYREFIDEQYKDYKYKLFLYLKPTVEYPEEPYIYINYQIVFETLSELLYEKQDKLSNVVYTVISNYKDFIERNFMKKDELKLLCAQIYRKHHNAIDLINMYGTPQKTLCNLIEKLLYDDFVCNFKNVYKESDGTILCLPFDISDENIKQISYADWKSNDNSCVAINISILKWGKKDNVYAEILFAPAGSDIAKEKNIYLVNELEKLGIKFETVNQNGWQCSKPLELINISEYFNYSKIEDIEKHLSAKLNEMHKKFAIPLQNVINSAINNDKI